MSTKRRAVPAGWARGAAQRAIRACAVRDHVELGARVQIGWGTTLRAPHLLRVGDDCCFGRRCTVAVDGVIGAGTLLANDVGIVGRWDYDVGAIGFPARHAPWAGDADREPAPADAVDIGCDVWIGFAAVVLSGVRIGRGAVVGAGAVVAADVEPYAVVAGNPARPIARRLPEERIAAHEALVDLALSTPEMREYLIRERRPARQGPDHR